ncbi:MAG: hypothetical protein NC340_06060 [Ruminococcus flavefaciens]|nr:hypothetical protein [Ruminococcus flavefaciens]MCM1231234.1 hypothetical protein [Ruminococcus flavefaciens]
MITNKNLFEMITNQMTVSNEELREQLKSQILEDINQTGQNIAQKLSDRYCAEINALQKQLNSKLDTLQNDIKSEMLKDISSNLDTLFKKFSDDYTQKIESLKINLNEKLDLQLNQIMDISKSLTDLQKDTAIIMETLQLILTNMMLNKISDEVVEIYEEC